MQQGPRSTVRVMAIAVVIVAVVRSLTGLAQSGGWSRAGSSLADYDMGIDQNAAFTGTSSGFIKSNKPDPQGFGTYMQMFDPAGYRGKRLRLSAYIRSERVDNWAGLWMRID